MLCNNCNEEIVLNDDTNNNCKRIAIRYNDTYLCLPCSEVLSLFDESCKPKKKLEEKKTETKVEKKDSKTSFYCNKCKITYNGTECNSCGLKNPLFIRKKVKKKKK